MQAMWDPSSNQADKGLWHLGRPWLIVSLAVLATLVLLVLVLVVLPPRLVPAGKPSFADLAKAQSDVRGNLVAALGVLAVLIGAIVGFLNFRESQRQNLRSLELSRRGQVSERFSKAIAQLGESGDDKVDVRIGAIYALEQIARDSPDELHGPIMETLTAFLRGHTGLLPGQPRDMSPRLRADFQAITTVLGRRDWRHDTQFLDLSLVDLGAGMLKGAHLAGADLRGAHLDGANLGGARLERADLRGAHLDGANLGGARLERADLRYSHLWGADLRGADLEGTDLRKAHLELASFEGARLVGANLEGATLRGAQLEGAIGLISDQLAAVADADLPQGLRTPSSEPKETGEANGEDLHPSSLEGNQHPDSDPR